MFIDSVKEPRTAVVASLLLWNSFTEFDTGQLDTFGLQHRCKDQHSVDERDFICEKNFRVHRSSSSWERAQMV